MIKNKFKLGFFSLTFLFLAIAGSATASAGDIVFSTDTNVSLTGPGITVRVANGSQANSHIVGASTITVTVTSPDTYTLRSYDRYLLNNDASIALTCESVYSQIVVTTGTVVITPSTGTCGGGGGGGGGGGYVEPPASVVNSVLINDGAASVTSTNVTLKFTSQAHYETLISNNADFTGATWENYLATRAWILPSGEGLKTVYVKYRDASGIPSSAVSDTITLVAAATPPPPPPLAPPTVPVAPPQKLTLAELQAQINELLAKIKAIQSGTAPTSSVSLPPGIAKKAIALALGIGSKGNEVTVLQNFLKAQGANIYPEGLVTGYFGPLTRKAIERFQVKHGIAGPGLPGYGNFGPKTRAKVNSLLSE